MRSYRRLFVLVLGLALVGCARGGTSPLYLRYQPVLEFPKIQEKTGLNLGLAPFKDERHSGLYVGLHTPILGGTTYYRSEPAPLEKAIQESLVRVLPPYGIKVVPVREWDGKPGSLQQLDVDSVLMIEIKKFWTESKASFLGTDIKTSIQLVLHLGVKKEAKVFSRNVEAEKEMKVTRATPESTEEMVNGMLGEIFDSFLANPY